MSSRRRLFAAFALVSAVAAQAAPPAGDAPATVAPGLVHRSLRRGDVAGQERFRVVVGAVERQRDADDLLARLEAVGESPAVSFRAPFYEISIAGHPDRTAAETTAARLRERGFGDGLAIAEYGADVLHSGGPWAIEVLELDPARLRVEVAHAYDAAFGVETTSALARRRGALAAINGGFYLVDGLLAGDAQGALALDGRLLSEPDRNRASVGLYEEGGRTRALFGRLALTATVTIGGGPAISVSGINRRRGAGEVVVYTPEFHRTTLTEPGGMEIVVAGGRVAEVRRDAGSSVIPADGFVVSLGAEVPGGGAATPGQPARFATTLASSLGDAGKAWSKARWIASAGPLLLWNGRRIDDAASESISRVFGLARHPRTAIAARADGTLLLVTVDGRAPRHSVGMSLGELTDLLLELGAVSALNLDGGGSTAMVLGGRLVNTPSDPAGERANGDALLVFPRHPPGDD